MAASWGRESEATSGFHATLELQLPSIAWAEGRDDRSTLGPVSSFSPVGNPPGMRCFLRAAPETPLATA